jgi:hypothetical protein
MKILPPLLILTLLAVNLLPAQDSPVRPRDVAPRILPRNPSNKVPPAPIQLQIEKFFLAIQSDKVDTAFNDFLKETEFSNRRDLVEGFVKDTKHALLLYGAMNGYELFDNRPVGSRLYLLTYFTYLKSKPLRWRMVFYSPTANEWKLINLSVDDLVDESLLAD